MYDRQHGREVKAAPNYLNAAITFMGINIMWIMFVVWVLYGFVAVLVLALMVNHFCDRVADYKGLTSRQSKDGGHTGGNTA